MGDMAGQTRTYLAQNPLLFSNLLAVIDRGSARLIEAGEEGVLLFDEGCGGYMMSAKTEQTAHRLLALIPPCTMFVGHELFYLEQAAARFALPGRILCRQAVWPSIQPPAPPPFEGELRRLDRSMAGEVGRLYLHAHDGMDYIKRAIGRGMTGAFLDGALAGFIGTHEEGSMGMLEVLPQYRRRGVGLALLVAQTRLTLSRRRRAFGQIVEGNGPSLALHQRAGFKISDDLMFWLI